MSQFEGIEDSEEGEWAGERRMLTGGLRRRPRAEIRVPVRVSGAWTDGVATFVPLLARSENLSEGGMTLVTPLLLKIGSPVMCSLRLDGEPVYLQGRVAWRRRGDQRARSTMGVEFVGAGDADIEALRRVLGTPPAPATSPVSTDPANPRSTDPPIAAPEPQQALDELATGADEQPPAPSARRVSLSPLQLAAVCVASVALGALARSGTGSTEPIVPRPVVVADTAEAIDALDAPVKTAAAQANEPSPEPDHPADTPPPADPHAFDLQLDLSPRERLITVPTTGSPDGLSHFRLASPPGVGVDLPQARAVIADGKYRIHHDGVLWLRVRSEAELTKLRVYLDDGVESYEVEAGADRVRLHLPPAK